MIRTSRRSLRDVLRVGLYPHDLVRDGGDRARRAARRRRAAVGARAALVPVADRGLRARRVPARRRRARTSSSSTRARASSRDLAITALVAHPLPRRPRGRRRDAPARVAPAAAQARARDADHRGRSSRWPPSCSPTCRGREAFLVGALLSPTDPVLSSSVVNNPRVPRVIRHSLNLESGLNDGLALPAVLALRRGAGGRQRLRVVEVRAAGREPRRRLRRRHRATSRRASCRAAATSSASMPAHQRALYALGVAFLTYGAHDAAPARQRRHRGLRVRDRARASAARTSRRTSRCPSDIIEIVKLGVFVVFGSLLTLDGLFTDGWAAVGIVLVTLLVARTVAVWIALAGTGVDRAEKALHGLVRAQGRGDDDLLAARARRRRSRRASGSSTSPRSSWSARSSRTA